jgi:hypothetical protein
MNAHRETLILASMENELEKISFLQAGVKAVSESGLGRAVKGGLQALGTSGKAMRKSVTGDGKAFKKRVIPAGEGQAERTVYDQQAGTKIGDWAKMHGGKAMEYAAEKPKRTAAGLLVGAGVTGRALT